MATLTPNQDAEVKIAQAGTSAVSRVTETPSGTGKTNIFHTVPTGKTWTLKAHGTYGSSLAATSNQYEMEILLNGDSAYIQIFKDATTGLLGSYLNNDIVLNPGDAVRQRINLTAYTSGNLIGQLLILEDDI